QVPRPPLRADAGLLVDPAGEAGRIEPGAGSEHDRGHDLVPRVHVGHAVHRGYHHVGMTGHHRLDRPGREVLAVDADPVGVAPGEVEVAVLVQVAQVAAPEPAVAGGRRGGLRVVVVALERPGPGDVDDLTDALVGVDEPAVLVEARRRQ